MSDGNTIWDFIMTMPHEDIFEVLDFSNAGLNQENAQSASGMITKPVHAAASTGNSSIFMQLRKYGNFDKQIN